MKIPAWMISEEMKHTEHYRMYAEVFGINVPLTQSQLTESTQGMYRTPITPRSTRLTPPAPVPTVDKADEMILQDTLQVSLAEHKSQEEQEARENMELVNKHLASMEIEKMVEGPENSDKESLEVEITNDEEVEITNVVIPVNVNEEEEEITDEVYKLKRREKGKIIEESRSIPSPTPIRSPRIHTDLGCYGYLFEHLKAKFLSRKSFDTLADLLQEVTVKSLPTMVDKHIKEQVAKRVPEQIKVQVPVYVAKGLLLERHQNKEENDKMIAKAINYMSGHILHVHPSQPQTTSVPEKQYQLYLLMKNNPQLQQQDIAIWMALQMKFETLQVPQTTCRTSAVRPRDQDDPHDDAPPEEENSAKRQKTSEYEAYVTEESSGQVNEKEQCQSSSKNQSKQMIMIFGLRDEHQYHIDQMKNFLKSDIVWESKKEILASPHLRKTTPLVQSCHEHKFITEIVARRANECIMSITEPDYKNLNKNDIEDMYLLIMNDKVLDYAETGLLWSLSVFIRSLVIWERVNDFQLGIESYQQKVNLTTPTISFPGIEKHKMFSIIYEPVHRIIYKNSKKEKRVTRHSEIHTFCDATLNRVLKGLKSYNNDVKYGYIQRDLIKYEVEYLKLFVEEIEVRLKYRNQMRRWEMYVNGRPLGPRRERLE
ncbi:hypothetical protein Tco_0792236 [Tanacetum coccineum]